MDGRVIVKMRPNHDPVATGHDRVAADFDREQFKGFPVLTAEVVFPGEGPNGWFAWVQLIRHVRGGEVIDERIDNNPLFPANPLYVEGYRPTFADAPANPDQHDLDWLADAYLATLTGRQLTPILGFSWGYRRFVDDQTELIDPAPADDAAWPRISRRLEQDFASWSAVQRP